MITREKAIMSLRPDAEWVMVNQDVESIVWYTPDVEPLTEAEVVAEMTRLEEAKTVEAQAKIDAKASAVAKLQALGLTVEEVRVAFGLEA